MPLKEVTGKTPTFNSLTTCSTADSISSFLSTRVEHWKITSQVGPLQVPPDAKAVTIKPHREGVISSKNCETENMGQQIRITWHREIWQNRSMVEVRCGHLPASRLRRHTCAQAQLGMGMASHVESVNVESEYFLARRMTLPCCRTRTDFSQQLRPGLWT